MPSVRSKLLGSAAVTALSACAAYLGGAWLTIYGFRPEHPEIHPAHLFRKALSHLPIIVIAFVVLQATALALTRRAVAKTALFSLLVTVAEVSAVVAFLHGMLSDITAFESLWWGQLVVSSPVIMAATWGVVFHKQRGFHAISA